MKDSNAKNIIKIFEKACQINCQTIDLSMVDSEKYRGHPFCKQCSIAQIKQFGEVKCGKRHHNSCYEAERWGGKYEYLCDAGAAFIATSFFKDDKCGFVAGPFLMVDKKEFISQDLGGFFKSTLSSELKNAVNELEYIECSRVSYIADMLLSLTMLENKASIKEAAAFKNGLNSQKEIYDGFLDSIHSNDGIANAIKKERVLSQLITQGNVERARTVLNEILGSIFFMSNGEMKMIKARITELLVILSRAAIEGGASAEEMVLLNTKCMNEMQNISSVENLSEWLIGVMADYVEGTLKLSDPRHKELIVKVRSFVKKNYMIKLSLNDISNYVGFSVSYISRVFKEETGENISTYINRIRVDNSKVILLDESIPLVEVAYLVGFDDQSYYSKVFKKITGVTPGRFRELKGMIE